MPIRPENRGRYPADWPAISRRIRERAGQRCEWCAAPNGAHIVRIAGSGVWAPAAREIDGTLSEADVAFWVACDRGVWRDAKGRRVRIADLPAEDHTTARITRVVLTVAHLDHVPEHCDDANLAALCQRCHLSYDMATHVANGRATRLRRLAAMPLPLFDAVPA